MPQFDRRRFLEILGAAAALPLEYTGPIKSPCRWGWLIFVVLFSVLAIISYLTWDARTVQWLHANGIDAWDAFLERGVFRFLVARIDVPRDAEARIVCEDSVQTLPRFVGAISD